MIYCVEDDADIREMMLYTLQMAGFKAQGFSSSELFLGSYSGESSRLDFA